MLQDEACEQKIFLLIFFLKTFDPDNKKLLCANPIILDHPF